MCFESLVLEGKSVLKHKTLKNLFDHTGFLIDHDALCYVGLDQHQFTYSVSGIINFDDALVYSANLSRDSFGV